MAKRGRVRVGDLVQEGYVRPKTTFAEYLVEMHRVGLAPCYSGLTAAQLDNAENTLSEFYDRPDLSEAQVAAADDVSRALTWERNRRAGRFADLKPESNPVEFGAWARKVVSLLEEAEVSDARAFAKAHGEELRGCYRGGLTPSEAVAAVRKAAAYA